MDWALTLVIIFGALCLLMVTRLPVAFCFLLLNIIGMYLLFGHEKGLYQFTLFISSSVGRFSLVPIPLFILMGEVLFQSELAYKAIDIVDKWMGRLPGRMALVTIISAVGFSAMSGSSLGTVAMLGSTMMPEMTRRGYKKPISLGAVMGGGGLDAIIPPSGLAVIVAVLAEISVGKLLIAGILPGLLMAIFYSIYLVGRCIIQPSIAPVDAPDYVPLGKKLADTGKYLVPFFIIMVLVLGSIFLGIATPTESSAIGALACFILAACYKKFNWNMARKSIGESLNITIMLLMILAGATAFGQIIAMTGASRGFSQWVLSFNLSPLLVVIAMEIIVLILGCFMDSVAILMIVFPIFLPIVRESGFDMILFGLVTLINANLGGRTPPYGLILFVMKGVAPPDVTMTDIYYSSIPFVICDVLAMVIFLCFPIIVTILPSFMAY
jgi:tripartite ATP-independent transporter DctM subunit